MKKRIGLTMSIVSICLLMLITVPGKVHAQDVNVSFQTFYDNLSPYGQWIYDPQYGYVFVPNEAPGFRPYVRGYWAMTEYGNTWVSDDPYGWACYHYGRWTYNGYYGWVWIPGYEWAPAWVSWRHGHGYFGWAPLTPEYTYGGTYYCPDNWWIFVEPVYIYRPGWYAYWGGYDRNRYYMRRTEYYENYEDAGRYGRYNYGPRAEIIERYTRQPVTVYRTTTERTAGPNTISNNTIRLYRPTVDKNSFTTARPGNSIQAPHPITGKGEAIPKGGNSTTTPQFRQEHPMQNGTPHTQPQPPVHTQPEPPHTQPQPPVHTQPEPPHTQPQPPVHTQPEPPVHYNQPEPPHTQPQPPVHTQPEPPVHTQPEPPHTQPQPPVHYNQPQPPHGQPEPPVHYNQQDPPHTHPQPPMHLNQPEPPARYNQPEPPRSQPQQQPSRFGQPQQEPGRINQPGNNQQQRQNTQGSPRPKQENKNENHK